jgi:hypothetical protein
MYADMKTVEHAPTPRKIQSTYMTKKYVLYLYEWIGLTQKFLDFIWLYC